MNAERFVDLVAQALADSVAWHEARTPSIFSDPAVKKAYEAGFRQGAHEARAMLALHDERRTR